MIFYYLMMWMPSIPPLEDNNSNHHGGHQGDAREAKGHVHRAAFFIHFHSADRKALKRWKGGI